VFIPGSVLTRDINNSNNQIFITPYASYRGADINKDSRLKVMARTKDYSFNANARTKD